MFRRYYDELSEALSGCPEAVAAKLYSAGLITTQEKSQALGTLGFSPFRKATILLDAVESRVVAANSAARLREFCHLLRRRYGIDSILARMKLRLGE